ncbi:zinc finger protein 287-like isoform X2 [Armigeres subalbatus]|uniref:zinc finger protein 287-like isoform X2 n=1 Tax=Armigeres subalbatus TaxID=124917 RepID=UPI002ED5264B
MAHSALVQLCRFCGGQNDVIVDLLETGLGDKLTKYFPLKFEVADLLPKMACAECASTIQQMEGFVLKAQEVERDLLERTSRPAHNNVMTPSEIRSLAQSMTTKLSTPKTASVGDVLRKLNTSSIVIKKVDKVVPKYEPPMVQIKKQPIDEEPLLKMKVEVLDEELEHLPSDNFVHYDDTDDDDDEGEVLARKSFRSIESVNIKEMHSTDESSQDVYAEERLEIEMDPDYVEEKKVVKPRKPSPVKAKPKRAYSTQSVVISLTDPCNYVCVTCKGKFSSFEQLQAHIDESIACKKVNTTCDQCGKICDTRRALYQHKLSHQPKPQLICDQCGKIYTNSFNLENHKSQVHGEEFEELGYVYKCCELTFPTRRELNEHIKTHSKILNLLCDTCGKSFTSHKALRSHTQSHLNIRPFSCDLCDKAFRTKLLLVQHSHVHTGIKAFKCDVCEKSFAKKDSLRKHYKMHSNEPVSWSSTGEKISVKPMDQLQGEEEEHLQPIHPYVEFATGMQETM